MNFFEGRADYPTFKKKRNDQSATYTSNAFKWDGATLTLAKMDSPVDIRWHRPLPKGSRPSSVTLSKDCANRYFISILVEEEIQSFPVVNQMVGIDLGIKSMIALSTGESVDNPRYFAKDEKKLARAQRRHARKQKGSKNRNKARLNLAKIHVRINDRRRDYQHYEGLPEAKSTLLAKQPRQFGVAPGGYNAALDLSHTALRAESEGERYTGALLRLTLAFALRV